MGYIRVNNLIKVAIIHYSFATLSHCQYFLSCLVVIGTLFRRCESSRVALQQLAYFSEATSSLR